MMRPLITAVLPLLTLCVLAPAVAAQPDAVETNVYGQVDVAVDLTSPWGSVETIVMTGNATIEVHFEGPTLGDARDDDFNGRDEVSTEMVVMNLSGNSADLGPVQIRLYAVGPSVGGFEEQANLVPGVLDVRPYQTDGRVDVFFDLFVELGSSVMDFHNLSPHRILGVFSRNPPGTSEVLEGLAASPLFDPAGEGTGWQIRFDSCRLNSLVEEDHFGGVTAVIELLDPSGAVERMGLVGSADIEASFSGHAFGAAEDDNGNGRDEIGTELVALSLTGNSGWLGPVSLTRSVAFPSLGMIEEHINSTPSWLDLRPFTPGGTADSVLDLFCTVGLAPFDLYSQGPVHLQGTVDYKPSGPFDELVGGPFVDLVDDRGQVTGWRLRVVSLSFGMLESLVGRDQVPTPPGQSLSAAPNPFNPRVQIKLRVEQPGVASLSVLDVRGRMVATLYAGHMEAGERVLSWDGRDANNQPVASGVYHLRLATPAGVSHRKITLVR